MEIVEPLKDESPRRYRRRVRLIQLIENFGGVAQVGREIDTPKSHLSALASGARGLGDKLASKIEAVYGKPAGWFDAPDGPTEAAAPGAPVVSGDGWPFDPEIVSKERYMALPAGVRSIVQGAFRKAIEEEEARLSKQDKPAQEANRPKAA